MFQELGREKCYNVMVCFCIGHVIINDYYRYVCLNVTELCPMHDVNNNVNVSPAVCESAPFEGLTCKYNCDSGSVLVGVSERLALFITDFSMLFEILLLMQISM